MPTRNRSAGPILDAVRETVRDLHVAGFIDKRRMREYDALCIAPVPARSSNHIRALRDRYKLSQAALRTTPGSKDKGLAALPPAP